MNDEHDTTLDRRSFLKNSAVGAFGFAGWAARDGQDGDGQGGDGQGGDGQGGGERPLYVRRMVFPYPERLGGDLRQKIIIMTDRKDTRPDSLEDVNVDAVDNCNFSGQWPPEQLNVWEGIIVDWANAGRMVGFFGGNPTVEATQLVERNSIFVENQPTNIPLGTTFIVNSVDKCPGDLVGVEATKVPGIEIQTGPGVSTGEATNDR
ncbi:hypothetical protein [Halorussus sp. MSC15.2]|uniref:hypothetical protein n=1 Tax=Halorussus sp. MSC15.2 TaxID=2283638 RepID=UPI0013D68B01|nr:hypothetical protein [Halorussus sp. MSC15.2]NEU55804.1 hypothetical protein [Halorussus sp. MSC15.2]